MLPDRRHLPHGIPDWVNRDDHWFVTVCCQRPCPTPLNTLPVRTVICEGLIKAQELGRLKLHICTLMPDHLHLIAQWDHAYGI